MDKVKVQLQRFGSERKGNLGGRQVAIKTLVLVAKTQEQLAFMVQMAAVDGWKETL